jgi:hypothetical protein
VVVLDLFWGEALELDGPHAGPGEPAEGEGVCRFAVRLGPLHDAVLFRERHREPLSLQVIVIERQSQLVRGQTPLPREREHAAESR